MFCSQRLFNIIPRKKPQTAEEKAAIFAELVLEGNVNAAIRLLDDDTSSGVFPLSVCVIETLRQKHLDTKPSNDTMIMHGPFSYAIDIIFDGVNDDLMRKASKD